MSGRKNISHNYNYFRDYLQEHKFVPIGAGSFREVYARKNYVIKIPLNTDGLNDNMSEARAWKKYGNKPTSLGIFLAPCRLLPNGCLMMVMVDTDLSDDDFDNIDWVRLLDGAQAGYYKGKIVAYDFALDLKERKSWEKDFETQSEFYNKTHIRIRKYLLED